MTSVANAGAWNGLATKESSCTLSCSSSIIFLTLHITLPFCSQASDVTSSVSTHLNMDNGLIGKTGTVIIQIDVEMCFVLGVIT